MTMTAGEIADYRKKAKEKDERSGVPWLSIKPDTTVYVRIGRPWQKDGDIWKDVLYHGRWTQDGSGKVYCGKLDKDPDTGKPGRCPVCRRLKKLKSEPRTKESKELFKLLVPHEEALWNVLVAKTKTLDSGKVFVVKYVDNQFKVLRFSKGFHLDLVELFADPEYSSESALGICSHEKGYLVRIRREGELLDTDYKFKVVGKPCPLSKDPERTKKLGATRNDLGKIVHASSEEELRAFVKMAEKESRRKAEGDDDGDDD
jgi:hypothetical protein